MADDWQGAHELAQQYHDPLAYWLHAVLHKMEGDKWNSEYWYAKTADHHYQEYADAVDELQAIAGQLAG